MLRMTFFALALLALAINSGTLHASESDLGGAFEIGETVEFDHAPGIFLRRVSATEIEWGHLVGTKVQIDETVVQMTPNQYSGGGHTLTWDGICWGLDNDCGSDTPKDRGYDWWHDL